MGNGDAIDEEKLVLCCKCICSYAVDIVAANGDPIPVRRRRCCHLQLSVHVRCQAKESLTQTQLYCSPILQVHFVVPISPPTQLPIAWDALARLVFAA
jgi:hypothetical protein